MNVYTSIPLTKAQKSRQYFVLAFGAIAAIGSIVVFNPVVLIVGLLLVYVSIYRKYLIINDKNVITVYNFIITKRMEETPIENYRSILIKKEAELTQLGFVLRNTRAQSYFKNEDVEDIIALFKEKNPDILIKDLDQGRF